MLIERGQAYKPRIRRLEDRVLLNATPEAAVVDLPAEELINDDFTFAVTFDNTASPSDPLGTGYGPFVDVTVEPGVEINSVTYLGTTVTSQTVGTWDGSNWVDSSGNVVNTHPFGGNMALPQGTEIGQTWVNVLAPFGSYSPDQPVIRLDFNATLAQSPNGIDPGAVPGDPIDITARGGFRFGVDELNNPSTDPPIQQGSTSTDAITPIVMRLEKAVQLAEGETAQGPNFPFTYTISIDVATNITVTDVDVRDLLPTNLYFLNATTNVGATSVTAPGVGGTPQGVPGADTVTTAEWSFATVTGRAGDGDIVITLSAYAPERDAGGALIIDPLNPHVAIATNNATVDALYQGNPVDAATGGDLQDSIDIAIRPYTVLKTVSVESGGPAIPGSYLRFQVTIDVSDYQAFRAAILNDILSDGLTFDTTDNGILEHTPVLQLVQNGQTTFIDLQRLVPPNQQTELTSAFQANGTETLTFFISNALSNSGHDSRLVGDLFAGDAQQGATTLTLVYFARIDETFRQAGRGPVVVNDVLSNSVSMTANSALPGGGAADPDGSQTSVTVPQPQGQKSVYAVNGVLGNPGTVSPGDTVTYRIRIVVASSDVDDLIITDYLPLPVYDVDANGTGFVFTDTQGGVPVAFTIIRGPDDTLTGGGRVAGVPVVTTLGGNNAIRLFFDNFDETASRGGIIDILYTVVATDQPFADGLLLVNQAVVQTGDSQSSLVLEQDFINSIILRQPILSLTKGVVATNATGAVDNSLAFNPSTVGPSKLTFTVGTPGFTTTSPLTTADLTAAPIVSDLAGIDAGDTVKFAIVIQNTGGQDAFDLLIRDQLPPGFTIPPGAALQLDVRYGDGTAVGSFTGDLFGAGLSITDGNGIGSIAGDGANDGRNIIIITYQLVAIDSIDPGITVQNAAELVSYAAIEGGTDFTLNVEGQFDDAVALMTQGVTASKRLVATDQTFTSGNDFAIGEIGTFQIAVTFPDGDTQATVTDTLPAGMVLVGSPVLRLTYINAAGQTVTFDGVVAQNGTPLANGAPLTYTYVNNVLTFDFSNVVANAAPGTTLSGQSFVIEYQVRASDDPALQAGVTVSNSAVLDTPTTAPTAPAVVPIDIVEPNLSIIKEFLPDVAQGGQLVQMRLTVQNSSASSSTTSFGLQMTDDDLPLSWFTSLVLTSKTGTGAVNTALVDVTLSQAGGFWVITVTDNNPNFAIAPGEKLILNFAMRVDPAIVTGSTLNNVAVIPDGGYTSLPGIDPNERLFEQVTGQDTLTILAPQITKTLINTSYGGTEYLTPGQPGYVADTNPNVLVGEILIYEIRVPIPRGTSQNVVVYDDTDFLNALGSQGIIEILKVDGSSVGTDLQLSGAPTFQLLDTDGDGVINRLRFEFGTIVNNATGAVSDNETIVITVRAQVMNVPETDEGDVHLNGTAVTFSVNDVPNFAVPNTNVTVTVTEPAIDVVKSFTTPDSTTDAGDIVTYTLTIRHNASSTADGFELNLTDQLPPGTILVPNSVTIRAGSPAFGLNPLQLSDVTLDLVNNRVLVSGFDLGLNQVVTITYQAMVAPNVVSGQALTNTVDLTYKSLPDIDVVDNEDPSLAKDVVGAVSERRDGSDGGPRTDEALLNNYAFTTTSTLTIAQPGPIIKTSDRTTYTIGEQIIYTITIPVIEGLTENPFLTDFLPAGFVFVPGSGIAVDANGNALVIDGANTITQTLTLDLASFTTLADNDPNNDFIRVSFRVQVMNVLDNVNDTVKVNTATFTTDHSPTRTDTVDVRIVEPKLTIGKTNDAPGPVDAGDIVTYSITVAHTTSSKATAYEFAFRDPTPAGQRVVGIVSARINGVDVTNQIGFDATGVFSLAGSNLDIPLGSTLTVVYQVEMLDSVGPGKTLTNTVTGDWSSLDGEVNPGAIDGERIGTPVPDANNYITSAQSTVVTAKTFEINKEVVGPDTQFTIGERVDYVIDLKVFEGTLRNVIIADVMVPGLEIDVSTLAIVNSGFAGGNVTIRNVQVTTNVLGYTILTFELDNDAATAGSQIVNPGDPAGNTSANDTIRIAYQAIVRNVLTNQQGEFLPNVVGARADDVDDALGVAIVEVVEPHLTIDKRQTSSPTIIDAGDPIDFEVIMTNDGLSTAYDVTLVDTVTPNAFFRAAIAFDSSGNVVGSFTISPNGHVLTGTGFTIAPGDFVRVVYTIVAADTLVPGDNIANGVDVQWTSTPGANPNERTGADGPGPDDTVLNNYVARDGEVVETGRGAGGVTIDKVVFDTSIVETQNTNVAVGEVVTFRLRINLEEGTIIGLHLRDFLPAGQRYIPGSVFVVPGNPGATLNFDPASVTVTAGNELIIPLGTVVNPGDNLPLNDYVDVFYTVVIVDDPTNVTNGAVLPNTVILTGNRVGATDSADVTVVEPKLNVGKNVSAPFVAIGDRANYTITVSHDPTSAIDAFDVVVSDPFDNPNMVLDPASITAVIVNGAGLPAPIVELVGTGFRVTVADLPVGATLQISFSAVAQNTATVNGQAVVNTATIDYDTVPGTDTPDEQRNYTDSDDATITIAGPDLQVLKDASLLVVRPGDLFSYTIQVLNKGAPGLDAGAIEQARNVVLTDTLPPDIVLHTVSVDGVAVPFSLDPVTRQFSINLGTMNPEQVHLVTLTVSVEDPLSPVFNGGPDRFLLVNTATATMDQPEPTPLDNTDTATVTALADPDLVITKTNAIEETGGSETVTFTITAKNVGQRIAAGVEIVDMVDTKVFDFVSASNGGTFDAATGRVIWQFNTLSPTDPDLILTLVLKVKPGLPASLDETTNVVVIGDNGLGGRDPTPDNNRDTHTDRLIYPDLVVTKTNNVEEVRPGDIVTYQITVSNVGAFLADGVRVTDIADRRVFRFISASDGGTYDPTTGRITWNLGTLQAGSTPRVLTLTMEVLFPSSFGIENAVNLVAITSDGTRGQDANILNNIDVDIDTLDAAIDPAEIRALFEPDEPFFEEEEDDILYISPMLTGRAAVGSYVSVVLIGPDGQRMELGSAQTPASGDWMISLPDMHGKGPVSAIVTTAPPVMTSLGALDANNVFFNPGGDSPIGFQRRYDLFSVSDNDSYTALQAQIAASEEPLALATRRFVNFNKVGATGVSLY
ncbi:hypothetical protein N185_23410 [Sinorhizobium sp. GW3]|nr:hypothetical protein N185_23410 [Sinorhizobium sp. GW3]